jgi:hypothetical protein
MVRFIISSEGLINVDHIVTAAYVKTLDGCGREYLVRGADERILGRVETEVMEAFRSEVLPAASHHFAAVVGVNARRDGEPPSMEDVWDERWPIVAWRITDDNDAKPILPQEAGKDDMVLIELPDGSLQWPYSGYFKSLDQAKRFALERACERLGPKLVEPGRG